MKGLWPFGVALRGEASNRPVLRWLKTVVVSDRGKGARDVSGGDQEDVPEASCRVWSPWGVVVEASKAFQMASKPGVSLAPWDEPGGCPFIGQVVPGAEAA
jgi:hypothetical protein